MAERDRLDAESDALRPGLDRLDAAFASELAKLPKPLDQFDVRCARRAVAEFDEGKVYVEPYARPDFDKRIASYRAMIAADDERDSKIKCINDRLGRDAAHDRYEALVERMCEMETALLNMPAPHEEALMWKVEKLYSPGDGIWTEGVEDQTFADLKRFLASKEQGHA